MTNKANIFRKKMLCLNVKHLGTSDNINNKPIYIIIEIKMNFKMFIYIFFGFCINASYRKCKNP